MSAAAEAGTPELGSGLIAPGASLEKVATGTTWAEGPVWIADRRAVRYSDIPGDRILEFSEETGELTVYQHPAGFTNGRTLDHDGSVVQCSHGHRAVEREVDGVVTTLVDSWRGMRLNSPNDCAVASDGAIWFTDPAYGIGGNLRASSPHRNRTSTMFIGSIRNPATSKSSSTISWSRTVSPSRPTRRSSTSSTPASPMGPRTRRISAFLT